MQSSKHSSHAKSIQHPVLYALVCLGSDDLCSLFAPIFSYSNLALIQSDSARELLQAYEAQSFLVSAQDAHHAAQEHVNAHQHVRSCLNLLVKHMELGWLLTSFLFIRDSDEDVEQPSKIKFAYIL